MNMNKIIHYYTNNVKYSKTKTKLTAFEYLTIRLGFKPIKLAL